MSALHHSDSIVIERPTMDLYNIVADVRRTGEWSPVCTSCWWDEGDGLRVGAWFTGRNVTPGRTWETRSQILVADAGREFAFAVGGSRVRWGFTFAKVPGGTRVTESWDFLPAGLELFAEKYGEDAEKEIADRTEAALAGIPVTLAAIKRIAESS